MKDETDYSKMTQKEFDKILMDLVKDTGVDVIMIPGVYEIISEYFNNDILEVWRLKQESDEAAAYREEIANNRFTRRQR